MMTKENATFVDVLEVNDSLTLDDGSGTIQTSLDDNFDYIAAENPSCFAISCWRTFKQLPVKTAACVFSTLNSTIDTVFSPEIRKMIESEKKVNFEQMGNKRTILFVTTSAVNSALHSFVNMFYAQAFKQLFEYAENCPDGVLPVPVHVLCDDFATGGEILNFPEFISIFREKGISVTLLLQSESQLNQMYGTDNSVTIINNCDTYIYLGGMDLRTAQNVSVRLNSPLDEVLYMPIGQEILFRRGQRPIITKRYEIQKNTLYRKITDDYKKRMLNEERSEKSSM